MADRSSLIPNLSLLAFLICLATGIASASPPEPEVSRLNLASTNWCPYICRDANYPGYIVEYMRELLAKENIVLEVTVLPWTRAIEMSRQGKFDGLLTAVDAEAPDFFLSHEAIDSYQMCFYGRDGSKFRYSGRESLANKVIAGIQDYGYGEPFDSMVTDPGPDEKVILISSSKPLQSMFGMLMKKRIDLFIEDRAVVEQFLHQRSSTAALRNSGCLKRIPFFLALSPGRSNARELMAQLDQLLASQLADQIRFEARQRYGLTTP